ncbi:MAG: response regulator transcription factor [Clostridia bacterium]|jgi:two-component system vancomycin resistance associated response regulator VraR|nr:response regulator transcription factor [Clostridia bacterium]
MAYKVLIVEDQKMPRQLFELFIDSDEAFELAASISSAELAIDFCRRGGIDLILMDVMTGLGSNGLEAAEQIKAEFPEIRIIIVTSMPEASWLSRAREIGVDSFWYKEAEREPILEVMRRTMDGESIYPDETPLVALGSVSNHDLSERELQVLRELISGDSNAEIGARLGISASTVKWHVQNLLEKTGMHTRTELAAAARSLGIVIR